MWLVDNKTAYACDHTWVRDADGAEVWIVAVKATYECLPDGSTRPHANQLPINSGLVLRGKDPIFETDLGPPKAATDVWAVGHAYSQSGHPVARLQAGFALGIVVRKLAIVGDRTGKNQDPAPFTYMPLLWSRAHGGSGPMCASGNPVGCGIQVGNDGQIHLPNLLDPANLNSALAHGVGPLPRDWPHRHQYAGTYDENWQQTRAPLHAADLDPRHWQVALPAQQVPGHVRGGEPLIFHNLTPPGFAHDGMYRTVLPKLSLGFRTQFYDGSIEYTRSVIHNVILLPDGVDGSYPLVCVVHHMALPCHAKVNQLDRTTIVEKQRPLDTITGELA